MGGKRWTAAEEETLENWAGREPFPFLVNRLQKLQRDLGVPVRAPKSIAGKAEKMGLRLTCEYDSFSLQRLGALLGVSRDRVRYWVDRYDLPSKRVSVNRRSVKASSFKAWAESYQRLLGGVDSLGLHDLTGWSTEKCKMIATQQYCREVPVKRLDTGQVYRSQQEAARAVYVCPSAIRQSIREKSPCVGTRWVKV